MPKWKIKRAVDIQGVPDVKERGPITQARIAQSKGVGLTLPIVWATNPKSFSPRVIGIKLQTVPLPLPEVNLHCVVIRIPLSNQVKSAVACFKRICLKEIARQARSWPPCPTHSVQRVCAWPERIISGSIRHQVTEILGVAVVVGEPSSNRSCFSHLHHRLKIEISVIGKTTVSACRLTSKRSVEQRSGLLPWQSMICERALVICIAAGIVNR